MFKLINNTVNSVPNHHNVFGNFGISRSFDQLHKDLKECLDIVQPKVMVEIGFNAGHSATIFLEHLPELKLYAYDIALRNYTEPCGEALMKHYGERFVYETKDSHKMENIPECDLLFIDGDHSYNGVKNDMNLVMKTNARYVLCDDMNQPDMLKAALEFPVKEIKKFNYKQHKKGRVGTVILFEIIR